jgi:hypothetical protein
VHRLRKRLREYYEKEGASHEIRLEIPTGSYVPSFVPAGKPALTEPVAAAAPPSLSPLPLVPAIPPTVLPAGAPAMLPRPFSWLSTVLVAAVVVLIFVEITFHFRPLAMSASASPTVGIIRSIDRNPEPLPDAGMARLTGRPVRIAAGQAVAFRDRQGQTWEPDEFFSGGDSYRHPGSTLARTGDPGLFEKGRSGRFGYDIPVQPGNYELRLFFAETEYGPGNPRKGGDGSRVFHVSCNGQRILSDFDILADAGGPGIVDERVFKDVTPGPDGRVHLRFIANMGEALVNAIELVPARPHRLNPIRIVVQDQPVRDSLGRTWEPDVFFSGGQVSVRGGSIEGARAGHIYGNERYGNFSYAIPVDESGSYDLTLYLAETYWGPENPGGGGTGSRVFDIFCNGEALVRNLDVFKQVGAGRALVERFRGLRSNAQGKLMLSFVPVKNYGSVYAIEVLDSSQ